MEDLENIAGGISPRLAAVTFMSLTAISSLLGAGSFFANKAPSSASNTTISSLANAEDDMTQKFTGNSEIEKKDIKELENAGEGNVKNTLLNKKKTTPKSYDKAMKTGLNGRSLKNLFGFTRNKGSELKNNIAKENNIDGKLGETTEEKMPELKLDLNQEQNNNKEVQEKAKKEAQEKAKKEAQEKAKKDKDFEIEIKADTANTEMTSQKVQKEKGAGKVEKVAEKVNKIDEKLPEQAVANSEEAKTEQANEEFEDSKYEEVEDYDEESEENEALEHDLIRDVPEIDRDLFILAGAIKDLSD